MEEKTALIKRTILYYLSIPELIDALKEELKTISANFYASRSLTGSAIISDLDVSEYQRSISPEHGAMLILDEEQGIKKRINRLSRRYNALAHQLGDDHIKQLRHDVRRYNLTELEKRAYTLIDQVEHTDVEERKYKQKQARLMRLIKRKEVRTKIVIEVPK